MTQHYRYQDAFDADPSFDQVGLTSNLQFHVSDWQIDTGLHLVIMPNRTPRRVYVPITP